MRDHRASGPAGTGASMVIDDEALERAAYAIYRTGMMQAGFDSPETCPHGMSQSWAALWPEWRENCRAQARAAFQAAGLEVRASGR
jgi:hypothetical protein